MTLVAPHPGPTATTVVLPHERRSRDGHLRPGRARPGAATWPTLAPRALVCGLEEQALAPPGTAVYLTLGDEEARALAGAAPAAIGDAHALVRQRVRGAADLTGARTPRGRPPRWPGSARRWSSRAGRLGAVGVVDGVAVSAAGVDAGPALDTTGAGDLFTAAYVWAELSGADPEERLRWAVLYAALSVTVPTAIAGATTRDRLMEEGTRLGLPDPAPVASGDHQRRPK